MTITTDEELAALRRIGRIVADCLQFMGQSIEPGMTTKELDELGARFLAERGARSAPQLSYGFPGATCISVNHEVAHGIPSSRKIAGGDVVNIDVSAELAGFFADTGGSFVVPPERKAALHVCAAAKAALQAAMNVARADGALSAIGKAIEGVAKKHQMTIIRNLGSHGIGRALHEEPAFIPGYFDPRDKRVLENGCVITIEPFLSNGAHEAHEGKDGWTLATPKKYLAAQYEHTMVIRRGEPLVVTLPTTAAAI